VLASLAGVAAAVLARRAGRSFIEAVAAAALVSTSFELATHARYLAPDALATVLAGFALAALSSSDERAPNRRALLLGALLAGMAASTKYTLGILAVPLCVAAWPASDRKERIARVAGAGALFVAGGVALTPGVVVEPGLVVAALRYQAATYGGGVTDYAASGVVGVAFDLARWLGLALASPFPAISLAVAALAVVGAVAGFRELRVPLLFAGLLALVFLVQRTFIPRNFLPLLPVLAVCAARGVSAVAARVRRRELVGAVWVALFASVAVDAAFLVHAASTIADRRSDRVLDEIAAFVDARPDEHFLVSAALLDTLAKHDGVVRKNLVSPPAEPKRLIARSDELLPPWRWPGGDPLLFEHVFGALEVNFHEYPTWLTAHVVLMDVDDAKRLGAHVDFVVPKETPPTFPLSPEMLRPLRRRD
jgi:4-amino-4-deoxy-L-arabinose transferase-like glycosyltransferase